MDMVGVQACLSHQAAPELMETRRVKGEIQGEIERKKTHMPPVISESRNYTYSNPNPLKHYCKPLERSNPYGPY